MMKRFYGLILIFLTLLAASLGFASDNFDQPVIFSSLWWDKSQCRIIKVNSYTEIDGKVFFQQGIGWMILSESGYKVLTPSHVVAGAQVIVGECQDRSVLLHLQSRTESKDLALLALSPEAEPVSWASPLIKLEARQQFLQAEVAQGREAKDFLYPDHFDEPFEKKLLRQIYNYYLVPSDQGVTLFKTYERDLLSHGDAHFDKGLNSLVAETLAIRPGFSGAPLFAQVPSGSDKSLKNPFVIVAPDIYNQPLLLGMLVKVEINGSRSFGISLPEILEILPLLMRTQDPSRDVYVDAKKLPVQLRYRMAYENGEFIRTQELVAGSQKFTEICNDTTTESSEWHEVADRDEKAERFQALLKSIKATKSSPEYKIFPPPMRIKNLPLHQLKELKRDRSIMQRIGGGDYGEGGGGTTLRHAVLLAPQVGLRLEGESLTSYKQTRSCTKSSLMDEQGQTMDTFLLQERKYKATNLTELFDLYVHRDLHTSSCSTYYLKEVDPNYTRYQWQGKDSFYLRSDGVAQRHPERTQGHLRCDPETEQRELVFSNKNLQLQVSLGTRVQDARGAVTVGGQCTVSLNTSTYNMVNRWKHQIRSPQVDMDISFGGQDRKLSIKILKVAKECQFLAGDLWMYELNFLDKEKGQKIFTKGLKAFQFKGQE